MPGRVVRTNTAVRVADFLATREGKAHLSLYGWVQGMPIVMTQPGESLNDAMAMVSIHGRAVLVAMLDEHTSDLRILHISTPQAALNTVKPSRPQQCMGEFFEQVNARGMVEFRMKFWQHTAVAHVIPSCAEMRAMERSGSRYQISAGGRPLVSAISDSKA